MANIQIMMIVIIIASFTIIKCTSIANYDTVTFPNDTETSIANCDECLENTYSLNFRVIVVIQLSMIVILSFGNLILLTRLPSQTNRRPTSSKGSYTCTMTWDTTPIKKIANNAFNEIERLNNQARSGLKDTVHDDNS